jgi:hypothetical protein
LFQDLFLEPLAGFLLDFLAPFLKTIFNPQLGLCFQPLA